jgi:hypothetical protein
MKSEYDLYSPVTFLLVGLGIGSILAIACSPKQRVALDRVRGLDRWRTAGLQPHQDQQAGAEDAKHRLWVGPDAT